MLRPIAALVLLLAVAGFAPGTDLDQWLVAEVNAARTAVGQPVIAVTDAALTRMAHAQNGAMARCATEQGWESCVSHHVPGGQDFPTRLASAGYGTGGEVIGRAYVDAGSAVDAWLGSPLHRLIILDGQYNRIGCAEDRYSDAAEGWLYTCVLAYSPFTPTPALLPTETPLTLPPRTPAPLFTPTPRPSVSPSATPDPRGPLPAGYIMRVWLPDLGNTATDCRMAGTTCFRVIQADYDALNRAPFNPWLVTDYLFYTYCSLPGVWCEWSKRDQP